MTFTRNDGIVLPDTLLDDLRAVALEDAILGTNEELADRFVLFVRYRRLPANHPQSYPRLTVEARKMSAWYTRQNPKPSDEQIAADIEDYCAGQWDLYNLQAEDECPNCLGKKGDGLLYARTGDVDRSLFGVFPQRGLRSYQCPTCAGDRAIPATVQSCGLSPRIVAARKDADIWWDFKADGQSREAVERVVKSMLDTVVNQRKGFRGVVVGPPGCGKSFMLEWLTVKIASAGFRTRYIEWGQVSEAIANHMSDGKFTRPDIVNTMISVPVLILDQFEKVQEQNASGQESFEGRMAREIIHARYAGSKDGGTLATLIAVNRAAWDRKGQSVLVDVYDRMTNAMVGETDIAGMRAALGGEDDEPILDNKSRGAGER